MPDTTLGFARPDTFPDFSDCASTTSETDIFWKGTIRGGGAAHAFSRIMPAFGDELSEADIDAIVAHLRTLCHDEAWPRGELNLPRPLNTEKAFPENEAVITTAIATGRSHDVSNVFTWEQRMGSRSQFEISVPLDVVHAGGEAHGGIGDLAIGLKRALMASHQRGNILSVQGEVILPTGSEERGLGSGVTIFEVFGSFAQMLASNGFVQLQAGTEQPVDTGKAPRVVFGRGVVGKSFRQDDGYGRLWSPMLEVLTERELESGASTDVDLVPQFQVTLSRREHVRANVGVKVPVTNTDRPVQVMFYVLWDWFDGRLVDGWR
jgi:hypothetical protein